VREMFRVTSVVESGCVVRVKGVWGGVVMWLELKYDVGCHLSVGDIFYFFVSISNPRPFRVLADFSVRARFVCEMGGECVYSYSCGGVNFRVGVPKTIGHASRRTSELYLGLKFGA
jgi:hypothetical protein